MPRNVSSARPVAQPTIRLTMFPAGADRRRLGWGEALPWWLGLASAMMLMLATVGWPWWSRMAGHAMADYYYWQGREADRAGEAKVAVQQIWQKALVADPGFNRVRLDLARSYIDVQWYGGALAQAEAVLKRRHTRAEAALAYTYRGYCEYLLGQPTAGIDTLRLAADLDPQNALAQSLLERLERRGELTPPEVEKVFRSLEGLKPVPQVDPTIKRP